MIALPLSPCSHPNSQLLYLFAFAHSFLGKLSTFAPITDQSAIVLRQCRSSYIIHIIPCISPVQILWSTYRVISGQRQVSSNPRNKKTLTTSHCSNSTLFGVVSSSIKPRNWMARFRICVASCEQLSFLS